MKTLILVRHGKTEQLTDYSQSDFDRKLLPRGKHDSECMAKQLFERGIKPEVYISSSAKRALQTAEIFASSLGYETKKIIKEEFIYNGYTTQTMLQFLAKIDDQVASVIVFGHNPDIASFTVNLISEDIFHFPTAVVTVIKFNVETWKEIEPRSGHMEAYMYPSMFS